MPWLRAGSLLCECRCLACDRLRFMRLFCWSRIGVERLDSLTVSLFSSLRSRSAIAVPCSETKPSVKARRFQRELVSTRARLGRARGATRGYRLRGPVLDAERVSATAAIRSVIWSRSLVSTRHGDIDRHRCFLRMIGSGARAFSARVSNLKGELVALVVERVAAVGWWRAVICRLMTLPRRSNQNGPPLAAAPAMTSRPNAYDRHPVPSAVGGAPVAATVDSGIEGPADRELYDPSPTSNLNSPAESNPGAVQTTRGAATS
jgi:hypothetical protein